MYDHGKFWQTCFAQTTQNGVHLVTLLPEESSTTRICVNRSVRLVTRTYLSRGQKALHPELEHTGPIVYGLEAISLRFHPRQLYGSRFTIGGNELYDYLKKQRLLNRCLSLHDGEAIQKKGLAVFEKFFGDQVCILWKSLAHGHRGSRNVPYLYRDKNSSLVIGWRSLDRHWDNNSPAPHFAV